MQASLPTVNLAGIRIDNLTLAEAVEQAAAFIRLKQPRLIVTPNPEIIVASQADHELKRIMNSADLRVADGISMVVVSRILKQPLKERVSGIDLMLALLRFASLNDKKVFLLGSAPGVVTAAAANLLKDHPGLDIVGTDHGYFKDDDEMIRKIRDSRPDILFVGLGAGRQEKWLANNLREINVPVSLVIGGSLDVLSGRKKRAPKWMQLLYIEWLYRLLTEPSRWKRQLALPKFLYLTLVRKVI